MLITSVSRNFTWFTSMLSTFGIYISLLPTYILMQFILQINEALVTCLGESNVS